MIIATLCVWMLHAALAGCSTIGNETDTPERGDRSASAGAVKLDSAAEAAEIIRGKKLLARALDSAYGFGNLGDIARARGVFAQIPDGSPHYEIARYWESYCNFHAVIASQRFDPGKSEEYVDMAIEILEELVDRNERFAEGWALLSSCYGLKASHGMFAGMKYGPKASKAINTAMELAPDNPRVVLVAGSSKYYTPEAYGGNKDQALAYFQRAAGIYDAIEPKETIAPDWGHPESYTYIGLINLDRGDTVSARSAFERALAIDPNFGWVKYELLPKLNEATK